MSEKLAEPAAPTGPVRRAWRAFRRFHGDQVELWERMILINRPWEEEFLHWAFDGDSWQLHGSVPPPLGRRRYSVTGSGWCPALAASRWRDAVR